MGNHFFLHGIFPTQVLNPGLLYCRQILYCLSHKGSPTIQLCVCVCVCVYKCTYILVSLCNNSYWISYIPLRIPRRVFLCTSGPQRGLSGSISPRVHSTALRLGAESLRGKFTAVHNPPSRNTSISGDVAFKLLYRDTAAEQTPKGKSSPIWIPGRIQ